MEKKGKIDQSTGLDPDSLASVHEMAKYEDVVSNRVPDVKLVLVLLSSRGMPFDYEALRQKIVQSYPNAAVFFQTPLGIPVGKSPPDKVDLLIDFVGPGQREKFRLANKLRRMARVAVGRNAGWSRKRIYDRIIDESQPDAHLPGELLERERYVQKKVLQLAGVAVVPTSDTPPDQGKVIPLELPNLQRLTF